jgi:hypothetical protein
MEHQVRITKIAPGKMDEFVEGWTASVARLRRRRGFELEGAWVIEDSDEFIWILGYDGEEGLEAADQAYYESDERATFFPDPAMHIVSTTNRMAKRVV